MIDTVFISDLHLHPQDQAIKKHFDAFIDWAMNSIKELYILGDFFHAWVGDDGIDEWGQGIALQIRSLIEKGIKVFYMHGNRDFLVGKDFARLCGWTFLTEPTLIELGQEKVLLVHGDGYCTHDVAHQRFRTLTRNQVFCSLFLMLPLKFRKKLVNKVRERSMTLNKPVEQMDVVVQSVLNDMKKHQVRTLIHGHTHKPGLSEYVVDDQLLKRYVLSDWDDIPKLLCYDSTKGFYFSQI